MYSFFLKALRITLGALLLFGITVITWNFLSRRDPPPPVPEEQFLSSEVKQQTTEFEYTERRAGRPEGGAIRDCFQSLHGADRPGVEQGR